MGLFTLTDIKFESNSVNRTRSGNLGIEPEYSNNILKYPIDVGAVDKGHYMIFHINAQDKTEYTVNFASNPDSKVQADRKRLQSSTGAVNIGGSLSEVIEFLKNNVVDPINQKSKINDKFSELVDKVFSQLPVKFRDQIKVGPGITKFFDELSALNNVNFLRTTKRTTDSVALYMPNTLNFAQTQGFGGLVLGNDLANKVASFGKAMTDSDSGKNLTPFIQEGITSLIGGAIGSDTAKAIFASVAGVTRNPRMEMIYTGPGEFRTFRFSFMFYPRSQIEAKEVQAIIARFNFHQVPEIKKGTAGYFLVPPSEFDIKFYYNGSVNPNIPEITTCVLKTVDVDYAPNGFQAFEIDDLGVTVGGTGMPVGIRMDLAFEETAIMTKLDFADKRGTGNMATVSTNKIGAQ